MMMTRDPLMKGECTHLVLWALVQVADVDVESAGPGTITCALHMHDVIGIAQVSTT